MTLCTVSEGKAHRKSGAKSKLVTPHFCLVLTPSLFVVLGFQNLAPTVKTVRADMVTQVDFAGGWFHCGCRRLKGGVRIVHTAFRRGFLVLLNSHDCS
jgi:hypothetical protein